MNSILLSNIVHTMFLSESMNDAWNNQTSFKQILNNCQHTISRTLIYRKTLLCQRGAPVAQWVKCWPTDEADRVRSSLEVKSSQP